MEKISVTQSLLANLSYSNLLRTVQLPTQKALQQLQQIQQKIDTLPKSSKPIPPGMQPSKFLKALAELNTANPDTLQDFLNATQVWPSANLPKPIPIGTHDSIQYFIEISDKTVHQDSSSAAIPTREVFYGIFSYETPSILGSQSTKTKRDYDSLAKSVDDSYGIFVSEAERVPSGQTIITDLKYGFGIGRLYHKSSKAADMEDTGFYVICNAVDKSIWIAFDFEPYSETGDINLIQPEYGDPYGTLPLDTQKMVIGIMRLFTKEWTARKPLSLDGGDPFCDGAGIPLTCKLVAKPAFIADVLNAIKAGRAKDTLNDGREIKTMFSADRIDWTFSRLQRHLYAEAMYQRALKGYEKTRGPDHPSTLDIVNNLGILYSNQGKLAEAETMYQRALKGFEKAWGPDHTSTLDTVNNLGRLYSDQGKLAEAEAMYQRALKGYADARGLAHPATKLINRNLQELQEKKKSRKQNIIRKFLF